jgi:FKBP-type peptidyl-prolyl cis-trans isomerase FkpA
MKSTYVGIGALVIIAGIVLYTLQKPKETETSSEVAGQRTMNTESNINEVTELQMEDQVVGTGAEAKAGDTVTVHYVGQLTNGKIFDASRNHGDTGFTFTIGAGQVIQGWEVGVSGMKEGGKRKLVIPPAMGYGAMDVGGGLIPANSTLIFEVELLKVN